VELQFLGANCIKLKSKTASFVVDDNLKALGKSSITTKDDIVLATDPAVTPVPGRFVIDSPGEYEIANTSVIGIAARGHMAAAEQMDHTMYKIITDDISVLITGHIHPSINDDTLEQIGMVDAIVIPVGGNGFTLDAVGAIEVIKKVEPKIIIPTYYEQSGLRFEVPPAPLEAFLQAIGMEAERLPLLKLKPGELIEQRRLVVLEPK
jgi:L-ascorbate metabolism protein UlaG (beta-lactamase superfamily)